MEHRIAVPKHVADRARTAIERMIAIGGGKGGPALSPAATPTEDPGE